MSITNKKNLGNCAVAIGWETTEGCAASTYQAYLMGAVTIARNQMLVDPQGTHGSMWRKDDGVREAAYAPTVELETYGTKHALAHLLGSQGGRTTSYGSWLSDSGDTAAMLSGWLIRGLLPAYNMTSPTAATSRIYVTLTDEQPAGGARVALYSDSGRSALVAQGSGANGATVTLYPQNSSGVSGQVNIGTVAASNSGITVQVASLGIDFINQPEKFFSLRCWTGSGQHTITGCVVSETRLASTATDQELRIRAKVQGEAYVFTSGSPTIANVDATTFAHADLTIRDQPSGANVLLSARAVEITVGTPTESFVGNSSTPQAHIRNAFYDVAGAVALPYSDEVETLYRSGAANASFRDARFTWTYGADSLVLDVHGAKWTDAIPPFGFDSLDDYRGEFIGRYDDSDSGLVTIRVDL